MHPSPIAETSRLLLPSLRFCIAPPRRNFTSGFNQQSSSHSITVCSRAHTVRYLTLVLYPQQVSNTSSNQNLWRTPVKSDSPLRLGGSMAGPLPENQVRDPS